MPRRRVAAGRTFSGRAVTLDWPADSVARLLLNRPAVLNAIDLQMIDEIGRVLDVAKTAGARALIIAGSGRAFCVGADLKMLADARSPFAAGGIRFRDGFLQPLARLLDSFEEMPFPVIAAIHGHALGGGYEMALSADFRIMASDAVIGLPEVKLGATPGAGGVQKLIRHVGRSKALEWILLGSTIGAEEAERRGLVTEVVARPRLMAAAVALGRRLCTLGPIAVAQAKRSIYVAEDADLRNARLFGVEALTALSTTDEWREGVRAFVEKRPSAFSRSPRARKQR
jgi:enoyl-CoA hydratase